MGASPEGGGAPPSSGRDRLAGRMVRRDVKNASPRGDGLERRGTCMGKEERCRCGGRKAGGFFVPGDTKRPCLLGQCGVDRLMIAAARRRGRRRVCVVDVVWSPGRAALDGEL